MGLSPGVTSMRQQMRILGGCVVWIMACTSGAAAQWDGAQIARAAVEQRRDVRALADKIDQYVEARWRATSAQSAPVASDAEFLRRVYLDLVGRIPSVSEARAYLKDQAPDKHLRLIDRLLDSPAYVTHSTNIWRSLLVPEADATFQGAFAVPALEAWLNKQFA